MYAFKKKKSFWKSYFGIMNKLLYIYTESVLPQPDLNVAVLAQLLRQWTPDGNIMSSNPSTTKQDP